MNEDKATLDAALAAVPGLSGRLGAARLAERTASIVVDATGMGAEARAALEQDIRSTLGAFPGVETVRVAMTADKAERRIIAVGSGKGGVGKSTVSANLAVALARAGHRVGLVDADVYGPSQPLIMGNSEKPGLADKQIVPVEAHGVRMLSLGQMVQAGKALAWRGPGTRSASSMPTSTAPPSR